MENKMESAQQRAVLRRTRTALIIQRSIAPSHLWHWVVMLDDQFFEISKQSFDSVEACVMSAASDGLEALRKASFHSCWTEAFSTFKAGGFSTFSEPYLDGNPNESLTAN